MIEAANEILSAATTIAQYHASQVRFDETKLCTIIEVQDESKGEYLVSDGSIKFVAYATSGHYYKDEQVYVLIPSKDYEQQKIILSKRSESNNLIQSYEDAFTNCVVTSSCKDNTIFSPGENEQSADFNLQDNCLLTYEPGVNRLLIKMRAICWPKRTNEFLMSGNYGIKIELARVEYINEQASCDKSKTREYYFLANNMFGNPYAFENYYLQSIGFDISDDEFFTYGKYAYKISLYTRDTFLDFNNRNVNLTTQYDLRIADVSLSFGFAQKYLQKQDQIYLYCSQIDFTADRTMNNVWLTYLLFEYDADKDTFNSVTLTDYINRKQVPQEKYNASNWYIYQKKDEDAYKRVNSREVEDTTTFGLTKGWKINGGASNDWNRLKYQLIIYIPTAEMEMDYTFSLFCRKNKINATVVSDLSKKDLASLQDNYQQIRSNEVVLRAAEVPISTRAQLIAACESITKESFGTQMTTDMKQHMISVDGYQAIRLQELMKKIMMEEMED